MKSRRILLILLLSLAAGCGKRPEETPAAKHETPPPPPPPMPELWAALSEHYAAGDTNAALAAMQQAFADPAFNAARGDILREIMFTQLSGNDVDGACKQYLDVLDSDTDAALGAFGIIERHLLRNRDFDRLAAWCGELEVRDLPEPLQVQVFGNRLDVMRAQDDIVALQELLPEALAKFPDSMRAICQRVFNAMLRDRQHESLSRILDFSDTEFSDHPGIPSLLCSYRVRLLFAENRLDEAAVVLRRGISLLPPSEAASLLDNLVRQAMAAEKTDLAEQVCKQLIDDTPADTQVFRSATRHWVRLARSAEDAAGVQQRLSVILQRGASVPDLVRLFASFFYFVVDKGDQETLRALVNDCEAVNARATDAADRARLIALLLDGSFMLHDYDRALRLLEAGIPDKDPKWHATLIPKVKAHKALDEDDTEQAINMFRLFMKEVEGMEESFPDPLTGAMVPAEAILAQNALRISTLWDDLGNADKATAAREEARGYYRKAIEGAEPNSDTYKSLRSALDAIPAG